jgi:hypothetical protein
LKVDTLEVFGNGADESQWKRGRMLRFSHHDAGHAMIGEWAAVLGRPVNLAMKRIKEMRETGIVTHISFKQPLAVMAS